LNQAKIHGLSSGPLVVLVLRLPAKGLTGYAKTRKVAGGITRSEQEITVNDELLSQPTAALNIDFPTIEGLPAQDGQEDRLRPAAG
jgi:hypothetical protein